MKKNKKTLSKEEVFNANNYAVVREAISKELAMFCYQYLQNKRKVAKHLQDTKFLSPYDTSWGTWQEPQVPNTYSHYADIVMETLLERLTPLMCAITQRELLPTYSYTRVYKWGDVLRRHKDRPSCEVSTTVNLGGDNWPIFLEPSGEEGKEGVKVELSPGDMLVYRGDKLEHWREPFEGYDCGQVFLHFVDKNGSYDDKKHLYDGRPMLGLPSEFRKY